jgi:hypothetical protein
MSLLDEVLNQRPFASESYTRRINFSFQPDSYADFDAHPEFATIFEKFTRDDRYRGMDIARLWSVALNVKVVLPRVDGAVAELGVYKGHMSAVLSHYAA